ncbi:autotransporter domain-containing protein [Achromobacter xylosoxidans]
MEFQFRQRPLSLLIGFLLLPPAYAQQDAAATATTTAHRNPSEAATLHDLGPHYDHTSWGMADAISSDGKTILGQTCVLTAPGSNECWYRSIVWTDGLANPTLLEAHGGKNTHAAAVSADGGIIVGYGQLPSGAMVATAWINAPTYTAIQLHHGIDNLASEATGVSADGSVIIGNAAGSDASLQSYRYQALSWSNGSTMATHLQALPGDSNSTADLISADGSVIAGSSFSGFVQHAVTWTNGSATATDLGVSYGQSSGVTGISANGAVIVGWSGLFNNHDRQAVSWTNGATSPTNLGMLEGGTESIATAVSADGSVIIGDANFGANPDITHAVSWSQGATTPTDLGSLHGYDSTTATALSANGAVIVGSSYSDYSDTQAVAWINGATTPTALGALGGNHSAATAISADGTVVVGTSRLPDGNMHAVLWKLPEPTPDPGDGPEPEPEPEPGPAPGDGDDDGILMVDVDNTVQTVGSLANDTFSTFETQRLALGRLQRGCSAFTPGKACYSLMNDLGKAGSNAHALSGVSLGYAFTERISAGVSLATALGSPLPGSLDRKGGSLGVGLHAQWQGGNARNRWYLRGAVAANTQGIERTRKVMDYTEAGSGNSRIKGWEASLELGRTHALNRAASLRYYGGLRRSDLRMAGYTEDNAAFPFTYADASYRLTTAYVGATYSKPLSPKLTRSLNAELEQDLSSQGPRVVARAEHVGKLDIGSDFTRTRARLSSTASYALNPKLRIGVTPYVGRTATREIDVGVTVGISGTF